MQGSETRVLTLTTRRLDDPHVLVSVSDTGHGLSDEVAKRLFQPFVTTKEHGMRIGLTICQSIVESHGGRIWAEANADAGVVFNVQLPLCVET